MKTLVVIILDESASMYVKAFDVISGFNDFINGQKEVTADTASAIFVKFNGTVTVVHDARPIDELNELTPRTYRPFGQTALFDAIWEAVRLGEKKEADFDRVLCLILTDGEENCSRMITKAGIRNLLKSKEDAGKWTFLYIGENPERWARETGISAGNVVQYNHAAPKMNFAAQVAPAVSQFRQQAQQQMQCLAQPPAPRLDYPLPHSVLNAATKHELKIAIEQAIEEERKKQLKISNE